MADGLLPSAPNPVTQCASVVCKATGQGIMRHVLQLILLTIGTTLLLSCSIIEPKRQRIKEVGRQSIPKDLLNTYWTLESFDNKTPDCEITIGFLDKGQLVFRFKDNLYDGDYLWYIVKDSIITFHTRPLEKLAWTADNCEINPATFALYIQGDKPLYIKNGQFIIATFDNQEMRFRKV
jgi:hypothetical protein